MTNFTFDGQVLHIENDRVERTVMFEDSVPIRTAMKHKKTGYVWQGKDAEVIHIPGIDLKGSRIETEGTALIFRTDDHTVKWSFTLSDQHDFIETRLAVKGKPVSVEVQRASGVSTGVESKGAEKAEYEFLDSLGVMSKVVDLKATEYFDNTDFTDTILIDTKVPLYYLWASREYDGHIFVLTEKMNRENCVIIKNSPCNIAHLHKVYKDFKPEPLETMHICGSGIDLSQISEEEYTPAYSVAMTLCADGEQDELVKTYYRDGMQDSLPYMISNTWGGCHSGSRVCEEFMLKEIEVASRLGIDVVQIDDGWETGKTKCTGGDAGVWERGFRKADPAFWEVNREKFPHGMKFVTDYAREHGVEMGLWFSPDAENDYEAWQLDADTIFSLYEAYGVRFFKLDGMSVTSQTGQKNITSMLRELRRRSHGRIQFNMDQTAGKRYGYFINKDLGELFIENRYTFHASYHPHATLRNLWLFSRYMPSRRFLFELLNQKENTGSYQPDDIVAPQYYDTDYLFATVMLANPLLWMELSSLDEEQIESLANIIAVYKQYRADFDVVTPIGEMPDGFSLTGFSVRGKSGTHYVLLFRELAENGEFPYEITEVLASNDPSAGVGAAKLNKKRSYLFGIAK